MICGEGKVSGDERILISTSNKNGWRQRTVQWIVLGQTVSFAPVSILHLLKITKWWSLN